MWETLRNMYRRELKKLHSTKSGEAAGTTHESKWQYFTSMSFVNAVMIPWPTPSDVPAAEESAHGSTQNFEDGNASTNVSINDNYNDEFSEGVSDERQVKNLGTKRKMNFQEETLHLEKRKIKLTEETLIKQCQADEDKDYMFLISLLPSIKKLDDIQRLELRMEFLSSVTRRIQISKNFSQPFNSVPTASNSSCLPSPSPCAASLDSTHSWYSDTSTHTHCRCPARVYATSISSSILRTYKGVSLLPTKKNGLPIPPTQLYTLKNLEQIC